MPPSNNEAPDALSPPKAPDTLRDVTFYYEHVYVEQAHDDVLENDACLGGVIRDSLFEGVHMGFSSRPGGTFSIPTERTTVTVEDTMLRLACQTDDRANASRSSCPAGTSHAKFFKGGGGCQLTDGNDVRYRLRNVIFRADHRPIQGPSGLDVPLDVDVDNVNVIYLGPNPEELPAYPDGVRVLFRRKHLDRSRPSEHTVLSSIDHAHRALSELLLDLILPEAQRSAARRRSSKR